MNEGVLCTPQSSRTGVSPPDTIYCHTQNNPFLVGVLPFVEGQSILSSTNKAIKSFRKCTDVYELQSESSSDSYLLIWFSYRYKS